MYDYVSPEKLTNALKCLKANNPIYADVNIDDDWLDIAFEADMELTTNMLEQPDCSVNAEPESIECSSVQQPVSTSDANIEQSTCTSSNHVQHCTNTV